MSSWINRNFDIDLWIKLATDDPYKFETQRQQWLQDAIAQAKPEQKPRLNGLLWEINMDLEIAKNKFTKCRLIVNRLVDHLSEFKDVLAGTQPYLNQHPATIFAFAPKEEHPQ